MQIVKRLGRALGMAMGVLLLTFVAGVAGPRLPLGRVFADQAVDVGENYYAPVNVTISVGETVTWTNSGVQGHTVTADDNSWGDDDLEPGQTYSHTFTAPGVYPYFCVLHDGQTGTITVQ
jgi:plastocyanin